MKCSARLGAALGDGLDAVDAIEAREEGGRVLDAVAVVGGDELEQQQHLLVGHRLDHEAVVARQEEHAAALARARHLTQRPAQSRMVADASARQKTMTLTLIAV